MSWDDLLPTLEYSEYERCISILTWRKVYTDLHDELSEKRNDSVESVDGERKTKLLLYCGHFERLFNCIYCLEVKRKQILIDGNKEGEGEIAQKTGVDFSRAKNFRPGNWHILLNVGIWWANESSEIAPYCLGLCDDPSVKIFLLRWSNPSISTRMIGDNKSRSNEPDDTDWP